LIQNFIPKNVIREIPKLIIQKSNLQGSKMVIFLKIDGVKLLPLLVYSENWAGVTYPKQKARTIKR